MLRPAIEAILACLSAGVLRIVLGLGAPEAEAAAEAVCEEAAGGGITSEAFFGGTEILATLAE